MAFVSQGFFHNPSFLVFLLALKVANGFQTWVFFISVGNGF
jgi:hypothetical protein